MTGRLCPGCAELLLPGESCDCQIQGDPRRKVYDARRWRTYTRPIVIDRDGGVCVKCGAPGKIVDHVVPLVTLIALGLDPFDPAECQLLCSSCSGRKDGGQRPSGVRGTMRA